MSLSKLEFSLMANEDITSYVSVYCKKTNGSKKFLPLRMLTVFYNSLYVLYKHTLFKHLLEINRLLSSNEDDHLIFLCYLEMF